MIKEDKSKRAFFKKAATVVGVIAAANYTKSLIFASADSSKNITNKYTNDTDLQSKTLLQTKLVVMTDNEKNQMLDEILDSHNKNRA